MLETVWESQVGDQQDPQPVTKTGPSIPANTTALATGLLGYDSDLICPPWHMPSARLTLPAFQKDQKETPPPACKPDYAQPFPVPVHSQSRYSRCLINIY